VGLTRSKQRVTVPGNKKGGSMGRENKKITVSEPKENNI
jgi:hypothetical protein